MKLRARVPLGWIILHPSSGSPVFTLGGVRAAPQAEWAPSRVRRCLLPKREVDAVIALTYGVIDCPYSGNSTIRVTEQPATRGGKRRAIAHRHVEPAAHICYVRTQRAEFSHLPPDLREFPGRSGK